MVTADEVLTMRDWIVAMLLVSERYVMVDIHNRYPGDEGLVARTTWEAREIVRKQHGIDFGPVRGFPGNYERKAWDAIERRAHRQRAKGTRAHKRAEERLRLAQENAPNEAKGRIGDAADRVALRLAFAKAKGI
jgi:hypothetical protein